MERKKLIEALCQREWHMFVMVNNNGGTASCQQDEDFFKKMRCCQFLAWSDDMLANYLDDLEVAETCGRNLLMEKYAWMMENTHPDEFAGIRDSLPQLTEEHLALVRSIVRQQVEWEAEVDKAFPMTRSSGRPLRKDQDTGHVTSFETYLDCELKSYSLPTLKAYHKHMLDLAANGGNMALEVAENTARAYGFACLADMEKAKVARIRQDKAQN